MPRSGTAVRTSAASAAAASEASTTGATAVAATAGDTTACAASAKAATALSIVAAAAQQPDTILLDAGAERLTAAQLATQALARIPALQAQRLAGGAAPLVGSNTVATLVDVLAALHAHIPLLLLHPRLTAPERAAEIAVARHHAAALPADAAFILHTSGTSGPPRAAVLTRSALLAAAAASAANLGWRADDAWLLAMPVARIGGLSILTRCLAARRRVVLAPPFDAAALPDWLAAQRVTLVSLVPTMLSLVLDARPHWRAPAHLRAVLLGGAPAPAPLLARAAARGVPVIITYGCTETCAQIVATPYAQRTAAADGGVGRPLPGAEVRVVDGRIQVRGPMRMHGYLGAPPLAAAAWFEPGDRGAFDGAGNLHFLGRGGDRIVSGGEKIAPLEVERVLESCPGVRAAAVFGVPDPTWGAVVAAALVADGVPPDDAALAAHLAAHLGRHKQPRRIGYVAALPFTAAGKLDRAALPALAAALRPLGSGTEPHGGGADPHGAP